MEFIIGHHYTKRANIASMTYRQAAPIDDKTLEQLSRYSPLLSQLLFNRGLLDIATTEKFLNPDYEGGLHDPFLMRDMEKGVKRILAAIAAKERIAIYSDYDCDGIPGAVVLFDFFNRIGHTNFTVYIPHRHYEGFGFNPKAVQKLHDDKVSLIITIDCGSGDAAAIATAGELGIDVIVTDHHEIPSPEPPALALINPKLNDQYPFPYLCGSGVVFKLVQALLARGDFKLPVGFDKWLLDMVGVATIADMVPLIDENRILAHYGLIVLRRSRRPGIHRLFRIAGGNQARATEDDIGFTIAPRVNAASRMEAPETAFHLLTATTDEMADEYARHLEALNQKRRSEVAVISRKLNRQIKLLTELPPVLVFGNPEWRPSLVGLVAGNLAEAHQRPAFVWGRDGNGVIKGSCRSGGAVSVIDLMTAVKDKLIEYGGHHQSGGFSLEQARVHTLGEALSAACLTLKVQSFETTLPLVEAEFSLDDVDTTLVKELDLLAPYGPENKKPIFLFRQVRPLKVLVFGRAKEHTKLIFETKNGLLEAICFFKTTA